MIDELHALLTSNAIFIRRTAGIGVLSPAMAIDYGCTGPVLRGSGVDWDLRRDGEPLYTRDVRRLHVRGDRRRPTASYPQDHPYPPVPRRGRAGRLLAPLSTCGCWKWCSRWTWSGRRWRNTRRPRGDVGEPIKLKQKLPKGEAYLETEAPKGQMGFMIISDGSPVPWRVRIRSSSFCNLSVIAGACAAACLMADVPGHRRLAGYRVGGD